MHTTEQRKQVAEIINECTTSGLKTLQVIEKLNESGIKTANGLDCDRKGLSNFKTRNKRMITMRKKRNANFRSSTTGTSIYKTPYAQNTDALALIELVIGSNIDQNKKILVIERLVR